MRRKLPEVMRTIGVALDDGRSLGRGGDVPADITDLRCDFCRFENHLDRLSDERNLIALNLDMGVGVLGVDNALERVAGMRRIFDDAGFGIDRREQAVVVDYAAAKSHLLHDVEQVRLALLVQHGDKAHGVDRVGIELLHRRMLLDVLLQNAEILLFQIGIQLVKALVVGGFDALAAMTALQILHFAKHNRMFFAKLPDLLLGSLLKLDEVSADIFFVELVELVLVLKEMRVLVVVHKGVEFFADQARHKGRALCFGEVVERKNLIIIVACAVLSGAMQHIVKNLALAHARALVNRVDSLLHLVEAGVFDDLKNVF